MDDQQRIALVETRVQGNDGAPAQLIRYQFGNHLGSSGLELDRQGEIISYEEYYPYGATSYQAAPNQADAPKRYRYTGRERDHEFPAEWAKFKSLQLEPAHPFGELTFTLREEHYPFWSRGRLNEVKGVEIFARTDQDIVEVADNADGDSPEPLVKDASLAGLWAGKLTNTRPLPAPVGKFTLYLNDNTMEELLAAVTWD